MYQATESNGNIPLTSNLGGVHIDGKENVLVAGSMTEVNEIIEEHELKNALKFAAYYSRADFGRTDIFKKKHKVYWCDDDINFSGLPYFVCGVKILDCQHGKNRRKEKKVELKNEEKNSCHRPKRKYNVLHETIKRDCPAQVKIKEVILFPDFKILENTSWRKTDASRKLRAAMKEKNIKNVVTKFILKIPDMLSHKGHSFGEGQEHCKETVHKDVIKKIHDLYMQDYSINNIMLTCEEFVVKEMFHKLNPPDRRRRKFFPNQKDVKYRVMQFKKLCKCSDEAEQNIETFIEQAKKDDENLNISFIVENQEIQEVETESSDDEFFEPDSNTRSPKKKKKTLKKPQKESTFLFCCQTPKQQRLLKRYGNVVFVVRSNGTSRTVPFQMYNVMVQTNVDYQTVCSMIISRQRKDGIKDGLTMLKDWNTYWRPKYFMVDCNKEIYNALDEVFPDALYFLNPQSCEDEWMEFLNTPSNELTEHADEVMAFLKNMAYSFTEDSLSIAAAIFEGSDLWHNSSKLRTWFQTTWFHNAKKWVSGYRPEDLLIPNHWKVQPGECLERYKKTSVDIANTKTWLETVVMKISTNIPEEDYKEYISRNKELHKTSKQFEKSHLMSDCYQGIPIPILPHIYDIGKLAEENEFEISHDQLGLFTINYIQSSEEVKQYEFPTVSLQNEAQEKLDNIIPISENIEVIDDSELKAMSKEGDDIESLKTDFLQQGEFTVSFGDVCNYPFCTCQYWQMFKLPCVHMFAVFCKMPDWKYDMMSPLYRCANVFQFDYSCTERITTAVDFGCQTSISSNSVEVQENWDDIFIDISAISVDTNLLKQCNDLLQHFDKLSFLFNEKVLHKTMRRQLKVLRDSIQSVINEKKISSPSMKKLNAPSFNISNVDLRKIRKPKCSKLLSEIESVQTSKDKRFSIIKVQNRELFGENTDHILDGSSKATLCEKFTVVDKAGEKLSTVLSTNNKAFPNSVKTLDVTSTTSLGIVTESVCSHSGKNSQQITSEETTSRTATNQKTPIQNTTMIITSAQSPDTHEVLSQNTTIMKIMEAASVTNNCNSSNTTWNVMSSTPTKGLTTLVESGGTNFDSLNQPPKAVSLSASISTNLSNPQHVCDRKHVDTAKICYIAENEVVPNNSPIVFSSSRKHTSKNLQSTSSSKDFDSPSIITITPNISCDIQETIEVDNNSSMSIILEEHT